MINIVPPKRPIKILWRNHMLQDFDKLDIYWVWDWVIVSVAQVTTRSIRLYLTSNKFSRVNWTYFWHNLFYNFLQVQQLQQEKSCLQHGKMGNFTLKKVSSQNVQEGRERESERSGSWCNLRRMKFISNFVGNETNWNLHAGIWELFICTHCTIVTWTCFLFPINECVSF